MSASKASPAQITYANILFWGSWSALALMAVTYLIYVFGILDPYVPVEQITVLWKGNAHNYLAASGMPVGWGWMAFLNKGDVLNFLGIAFMACMTIFCFLSLIPAFIKERRPLFAIMAAAEILILALAASGVLKAGGH